MPDNFKARMEGEFKAMVDNPYIMACREAGGPLPPPDCVRDEGDGDGTVFDWRHPGEMDGANADTPVSSRWRFQDGKLVAFTAYGWCRREVGYGRSAKDPEWGYSILSPVMRDEAARRELSMETVA